MKYKLYVLVLIVTLFLITSCTSGGQTAIDYNFKQGVSELNVELLDNAPPDRIFPESRFKIVLELSNQAAYDIKDGEIVILGLVPNYFELLEDRQNFGPLAGRSVTNPSGDTLFLEFEGTSGQLFHNEEEHRNPYKLHVKYSSSVDFTDTVCIKPQLYDVYSGGCTVQGKKSYSGQGAPLAITEMEEIIIPGGVAEVEFRLKLQKRGKGEVGDVELASESARLGNEKIDCVFQDTGLEKQKIEFKKDKQEATLVCRKQLLRAASSYETTLALGFTYEYEFEEKHRLTLIK